MNSASHIVICMQSAADDMGLMIPSVNEVKNIIGLGIHESIDALFPDQNDPFHQKFIESYRKYFYGRGEMPSDFFPGAISTLKLLQTQGYILAIATGKGRKGLDYILDKTRLGDLFHCTRCADETASKPDPKMVHEILQQLDVEPGHAIMIGDSEYDMAMAQNAGIASIAVTYGVHEEARLKRFQPIHALDDIVELPQYLQALQSA